MQQFIGQLTYISTYLTVNLIKINKSLISKFFGKQLLKEIEIINVWARKVWT